MSVFEKFEWCVAKTVGGVGFFVKAYFSLQQFVSEISTWHLKWKVASILMCEVFGDDQISALDFSFIGAGVPLTSVSLLFTYQVSKSMSIAKL